MANCYGISRVIAKRAGLTEAEIWTMPDTPRAILDYAKEKKDLRYTDFVLGCVHLLIKQVEDEEEKDQIKEKLIRMIKEARQEIKHGN